MIGEPLDHHERAIVRLVGEGKSDGQIAIEMDMMSYGGERLVRNYLDRIYNKLGVNNRIDLIFLHSAYPTAVDLPSAVQRIEELVRREAGEGRSEEAKNFIIKQLAGLLDGSLIWKAGEKPRQRMQPSKRPG